MDFVQRFIEALRVFLCTLFGCHDTRPPISVVFTIGPVETQPTHTRGAS